MDYLPELSTVIPSAGVLGLLAWLVVHFVRQGGADRTSYTEQLTKLRQAHDEQIESLVSRHDKQISDLRGQLDRLQTELNEIRRELETERRARWAAEDDAAKWRRLAGGVADDAGST